MAEHRGAERLVEFADALVDDPAHITHYRAIDLAEGLQQGSEADVLWAWQWLRKNVSEIFGRVDYSVL
ncbi:MAG: hypothetical protein ND866_25090 [Pyrinomonadaceae bacterium]|nr:hypothetical protein [Pyrinomonadaceae bacterium]